MYTLTRRPAAILLLLSLFILPSLSAQLDVPKYLELNREQDLPEKVFLHTDKQIYASGESIWMAIYLLDGQTHIAGTYSSTIYVELKNVQGESISDLKVISNQGHASASLTLSDTLQEGNYALLAYTEYQRNGEIERIFKKKIKVVSGIREVAEPLLGKEENVGEMQTSSPNLKLRYFPEGGQCLTGQMCKIAVVAENEHGQGSSGEVSIYDGDGKMVSQFIPNQFGIGLLNLLPQEGSKYFGKVAGSEEQFELPVPERNGYQVSVLHIKDRYRITAKTNSSKGLNGARIIIHMRGVLLLDYSIQTEKESAILDIPDEDLFSGVVTITLLDPTEEAVSERIFFVHPNKEESQIMITSKKDSYGQRDDVNLDFQLAQMYGEEGKDSIARLSYTVIPEKASGGPKNDNIVTWLLLNSDLKEHINLSDTMVLASSRLNEKLMDDFMLTRGWRRFDWMPISEESPAEPKYLLEQGLYIQGMMGTDENAKKPRPGKVFMSNMSTALSAEVNTDDDGRFVFGPYVTFDTLNILVEGRYRAGKRNRKNKEITKEDNPYVSLSIFDHEPLNLEGRLQKYLYDPVKTVAKDYKSISDQMLTIAKSYDSLSIVLDVFEVEATRITKEKLEVEERTSMYGNNPDNRLVMDSIPGSEGFISVIDLLRRVPGLRISGSTGNEQIVIRGFNSITLSPFPAYFLDGIEVDLNFIRNYPVANIDFVDVIKGSRASIYGSRGANGIIFVYTKRANTVNREENPGQKWTKLEGYHKKRIFPVFDPQAVGNQNRPDIRTTLFWNPALFLKGKGKANQEFKTSDQEGTYRVIAQGLTFDGRPVYGETTFEVEK